MTLHLPQKGGFNSPPLVATLLGMNIAVWSY